MKKTFSLGKFRLDPFLIGLVLVIVIAYFFPFEKSALKELPINGVLSLGISLIFFFYGLKLSPEKLTAGLKNWKLHILIQLSTFLLFPLLVLIFYPFIHNEQQELIWMGIFFLAVLPSTVSSSVVMVSMAKGNIPASIFNASISGLIGIFITPLWLGLIIKSKLEGFDFSELYLQLALEIVLPVILGILLQRWLGKYGQRFSKQLATFDKSIILLIIYNSFSHSFATNLFVDMAWPDIAVIFIAVLALFTVVYQITGLSSKRLKFNQEDQITAQFCGTKKSLVHGTVFFNLIFVGLTGAEMILIPLILFHSIQILLISFKANNLARDHSRAKVKNTYPSDNPHIDTGLLNT